MSLITAIVDSLKGNFVPAEVKDARMVICKKCVKKRGMRCIECGCFLDWKLAVASESCPLNKWEEYNEETK